MESKNPRALQNIYRDSVPAVYRIQKSACMGITFKVWFFNFFVSGATKYLKECGLPIKAVLLIAPFHP